MAVRTIGDVARCPRTLLVRALGPSLGAHLQALARNDDDREVVPERETKSIGAEETFAPTCTRERPASASSCASPTAPRHVSARRSIVARTVTLKVRFGNFETKTRARTLPEATDLTALVADTARALLDRFDVDRGVRLLGVSLSHLERAGAVQQVLRRSTKTRDAVDAHGSTSVPRSNVPPTRCVPASVTTRCSRPSLLDPTTDVR